MTSSGGDLSILRTGTAGLDFAEFSVFRRSSPDSCVTASIVSSSVRVYQKSRRDHLLSEVRVRTRIITRRKILSI
jgi:hypothetical protein